MAICARPGCGKPTFNGQPNKFCTKGCRDAGPVSPLPPASASLIPLLGSPVPLDGSPPMPQHAADPAIMALLQQGGAAGNICIRPGCGKPSFNGRPGEYCSRTCRDAGVAPGGALCVRLGCGKPSWNGLTNEFCGRTCRQQNGPSAPFGTLLDASDPEYQDIESQIQAKWDGSKVAPKQVRAIWKLHASQQVKDSFQAKCRAIGDVKLHGQGKNPGNQQRRFHGTTLTCRFNGHPCSNSACRVCCIIRDGFDITKLGQGSGNNGCYGAGHYSTSMPATAIGYGSGNALLVVIVAVGKAEKTSDRTSDSVSSGHHSRVVNKSTGVDELLVPGDDQMLAKYLVLF
mmetsp:Transcript_128560/g.357896  ORF Transcript_128560/g.357896 Transcript_128560/m.357896 type:complete len:343 (-) Transcript_128560:167-1195(-)